MKILIALFIVLLLGGGCAYQQSETIDPRHVAMIAEGMVDCLVKTVYPQFS